MTRLLLNPKTWFAKPNRVEDKEDRKDDPAKMQKDVAIGFSTMLWLMGGLNQMTNPDKLVAVKGAKIYNKMLFDDQVDAAFNLKLNLIISRKFKFISTGSGQDEAVDFFERNTRDLISGTWLSAMRSVLMGKAYGYSVSEKIFRSALVDKKLRWVIDRINLKPYDTILFSADEYGNRTGIHQDMDGRGTNLVDLDINKFIIYINKPEIDPIWGQSDLKAAYMPYWEKDITRKYWNVFVERVAGGFPVITPEEFAPAALDPEERSKLEKLVKNVTGITGAILPKGYKAEVIQAESTDAFQKKMEHHDKQIARSLLTPNLLGFSEQGGVGSYAQSKTQFNLFSKLITEEGDYLAEVFNEQLFSQLAWWNFKMKEYPRMVFEEFTPEQKLELAKAWSEAIKGNAVTNSVDDELKTRDYLAYPLLEKDDLEKLRENNKPKPLELTPQQTVEDQSSKENKTIKPNDDSSTKEGQADIPTKSEAPKTTAKQSNSTGFHVHIHDGKATTHFSDGDNVEIPRNGNNTNVISFVERVDSKTVQSNLNSIEISFYDSLSSHIDGIVKDVSSTIKSLRPELAKNKSKLDSKELSAKFSKSIPPKSKANLKNSISSYLQQTYNEGWNTAHKATLKAATDVGAPKKFINRITGVALLSERKICSEQLWTVINFVEGLSLEAAEAWFKSQSFKITGDLTEQMMNSAIAIMTNGITNDWSTEQMVNEFINSNINITGGTTKQERARLETIVRTNMSTIFTQASLAFYNDPDLKGFVEAMQYSSIIDTRTTDICIRLDNSVYPMNDQIWRFITPPNHFQCRSILIPVTVLDEWKRDNNGFTENQLPGKGFGQSGLAQMFDIQL